ncbi:hypothetical protein TWF281_003756 [Arthrobotrys megalospora]
MGSREIAETLFLPERTPSETQTNIRRISLKSADGSNDGDEGQGAPFYSREAARVVLDPGTYRSGTEPEPYHRWEPIRSTTPAAHIWNQNLDSAMRYLTCEKGIPWTVLHLGLLDKKVTVVILYDKGAVWDQRATERELRELYFPQETFTDIIFAHSKVNKGAALEGSEYGGTQSCGAGIGVKGVSWSAGTVGGYFESETGEIYGLSCHHVLLPTKGPLREPPNLNNDEASARKGYPEYLDTIGVYHSAFEQRDGAIEVVQPPCGDHIDTILELQALKKEAEKGLEALTAKYNVLNIQAPKGKFDNWQATIEESCKRLAEIEKYDRTFGVVVASSGYKIDPMTKHSIDWALFRISENRTVWNMIPGVDAEKRRGSWNGLSTSQRVCNGIADPVEDESVFKIGRKTGPTFGIISGVRDGVNLKENLGKTKEWCVVGRNGTEFAAAGDSGSLVFNEKFQVVGILTAGCDNQGRLTYITPIKLVLADIEKATGEKLEFYDGL